MKAVVLAAVASVGVSMVVAQDAKPGSQAETKAIVKSAPLTLFPDGYLNQDRLTAELRRIAAAYPKAVRLDTLEKSGQGRDVWLATLGRTTRTEKSPRPPSILLVAGLEADHLVGGQVALGLIERLAEADGKDAEATKLLDRYLIYVIPRLNPDGAERAFARPLAGHRLNLRAIDRDRDGKRSEDGPDDLDGDGVIVRMRVKDAKAALVPDEKDQRILRKADPAKGERGVYSEYSEGRDDDGDGEINEDPAGGVNLNRNWPHRWTEFDPEAGVTQLSEPETRALIKMITERPEIALIWTFGLNDNLRSENRPGLDPGDSALFSELARRYNQAIAPAKSADAAKKDAPQEKKADAPKTDEKKQEPPAGEASKIAEQTKKAAPGERAKGQGGGRGQGRSGGGPASGSSPSATAAATATAANVPSSTTEGTTDGALSEWAYHQFGVVGLASRLWTSPEIPEPAEGRPTIPAEGEARRLYWNDHVMGGRAFVPFKTFKHPTLGQVEVGGWKPGVLINPPVESVKALTDAHFTFLKDLGKRFAELNIIDVKVEHKGGGVFEIKAGVENSGYLPTASAQGVRTRKADPVLVRLRPGAAKLLGGRPLERIDSLAGSGGRREYRWLILAPDSVKSIELEVSTAKAGRATKSVELPGRK